MANEAKNLTSTLKLKYLTDEVKDGDLVYKTKSYTNLKANADIDSIWEVSQKIGSLSEYSLKEIYKIDTSTIEE
jgi:hypothetical protein